MGEPTFHLDADLNPVGMSMGCSSRLGPPFLGTDGSFLLCGLLEGHDGRHLFHVEWDDEAALIEHPGRASDHGSQEVGS